MSSVRFYQKSIIKRLHTLLPTVMLPFDGYQRLKFTSELIRANGGNTILDVGGAEGAIRRFLKYKKVLILDLNQGDVLGSGVALPFKNASFDAVVSVDVLEHVSELHRIIFVHELVRVAKNYVIITAPFKSVEVLKAEKECNALNNRLFGEDHPWLKEHIDKGLPDLAKTVDNCGKYDVHIFDNGELHRWIIMLKLNLILQHPCLSPLRVLINGIYNLMFYHGNNQKPTYRKVMFVKKYDRLELAKEL